MARFGYPKNPSYGTGAFRRRVRMRATEGLMTSVLDDNNHSMWCRVLHDGTDVTAIEGGMRRVPFNTCSGAQGLLGELTGTPLNTGWSDLSGGGRARRHCTHLFDLAVLSIRALNDQVSARTIDIVLHDARAGRQTAEAGVDGHVIHAWSIENEIMIEPVRFAGQHVTRGFIRWACSTMRGVELDAALMLQKGVMVARSRPYLIDATPNLPLLDRNDMVGSCFTFTEPRFSAARSIAGHVEDYSLGIVDSAWPDRLDSSVPG